LILLSGSLGGRNATPQPPETTMIHLALVDRPLYDPTDEGRSQDYGNDPDQPLRLIR
jgi:hypothetical protein